MSSDVRRVLIGSTGIRFEESDTARLIIDSDLIVFEDADGNDFVYITFDEGSVEIRLDGFKSSRGRF